MISAFLAFFHARKWLAELLLLAVIAGGAWWFCQHLIDVGVQRERATWSAKLAEAQRKADIEAARLQARADVAEKAGNDERKTLHDFVRNHPLHGGLCKPAPSGLPTAASANGRDARAAAGTGDVQPLPEGSVEDGGRGEPDVRHLLDILAGRADLLSSGLREWQSR